MKTNRRYFARPFYGEPLNKIVGYMVLDSEFDNEVVETTQTRKRAIALAKELNESIAQKEQI